MNILMNSNRIACLAPVLVLLTAGIGMASAGPGAPNLNRYTIDAGGVTASAGGSFQLSGTIGQPDARTEPMAGGGFSLVGGFWVPPSTTSVTCAATAWRSVRTHGGGLGDLPIDLDPAAAGVYAVSETRRGGVQRVEIDFDKATSVNGVIEAEDLTYGGGIAASDQYLVNGDRTLVIEFADGLPDGSCCRIDLAGRIADLAGDTDCRVRCVEGDTNDDGVTNNTDKSQVASLNGTSAEDGPRFDVNVDGSTNNTDKSLVASRNGHSAACP